MMSIIIPACNEENYILETLDSIKRQQLKNYEIIVVCDGCTDKTAELINNKVDKVVVNKKRLGPAESKNIGAKYAKGGIFVFLDADTKLTSGALGSIQDAAENGYYGTCRIKPSSDKIKHKIMMSLKNFYPFPFTNGIIFCSRNSFYKVNCFDSIKKGEDGKIVRKLNKEGNFVLLDNYVVSSTRRFDQKGYIKTMVYWIKEYIMPSNDDYEVIR
ncbi:MAG TPA: glycosyltransferase [Candidatus Nanoarchaeia archaeon]|nr:glycosyltransferase [Candidatus Nanoarchaeia archaeon]